MSNQATTSGAGAPRKRAIDKVNASLKRRYAAERRFHLIGMGAVILGLSFVAILFLDIISKGYPAFQQTYIQLQVHFAAGMIDPDGSRERDTLVRANYLKLVRDALKEQFPEVTDRREQRAIRGRAGLDDGQGAEGIPIETIGAVGIQGVEIEAMAEVFQQQEALLGVFLVDGRGPQAQVAPGAGNTHEAARVLLSRRRIHGDIAGLAMA